MILVSQKYQKSFMNWINFCFRIKITGIHEYSSSHSEAADTSADLLVEPPLQENIVTTKPILMVKVENVLHEPFKVTEEVKVWYQ